MESIEIDPPFRLSSVRIGGQPLWDDRVVLFSRL